jgi:hypothetical protein
MSLIILLSLTVFENVNAQKPKFPIFNDQRIARPEGLPQFTGRDINIDLRRLEKYPKGIIYGDKTALKNLGEFLLNDPAGRKLWTDEVGKTVDALNKWDFNRTGFGVDRYIYNISQLEDLSLIFLFSGHKQLGQFIRAHVMQVAELPFEFWLHSELRGFSPEKPLGMLETSAICTSLAVTLSITPELYSPAELNKMKVALLNKGLIPCLNWLDNPRTNNFTAVISNGAFMSAKYLNNSEGRTKAVKTMAGYLNGCVEDDGSYGEGTGYFSYPISTILPALIIMNPEERQIVFGKTGLRNSASWKVYPYLYPSGDKQDKSLILHFGDNSFSGPTKDVVNTMFALLYKDQVASWLTEKFGREISFRERFLIYSFNEGMPQPLSPEEKNMPLVKVFNGGDCIIRSTWKDDGIVLGMRSGDGSRINFGHQRPELSSICLGAYGEYLIVSPGSASYRSPLHYTWDRVTRSANTITIDDKNQLFPGTGKGQWNTADVSQIWMEGNPKAEVVQSKEGKLSNIIVNEAAKAYHVPMKYVRRSVIFIKDPGYFVIADRMETNESQHKYSMWLHLNNRDEQGKIKTINQNHWQFTRPLADLDIFVYSDQKMESKIGQGYMHGASRDYSPGGIYEGKPGSSTELEIYNPEKSQSLTYYSVLFPSKKGTSLPEVKFNGKKLTIGKDVITFYEGTATIKKGAQTENYKLW